MMNKKHITIAVLLLFFLSACQKDTDVFVPDAGQQLDSAWVSTITSNAQVTILANRLAGTFDNTEFQVNALSDTVFGNNTGFVVEIPRGTLSLAGTAYTGTVRAEFKLLLKKGDFIRYGVPTVSNRFPLESGGAFLVRLFNPSGTPVIVNPSKRISIRYIDELAKPNMSLYYSTAAPTSAAIFNWIKDTDSQVSIWQSATVSNQRGYVVSTARTGWLNVDRLLEQTPSTEVNVVLPNLFSNANTAVYMVFKNIRSVVQLSGNNVTRTFGFTNIPVNSEVKFITISKVGDSYYLGIKDDKITANYSGFVKPEISNLEKINQLLNSL